MNNSDKIICTIGHSTRSFAEFLLLLKQSKIEAVADIRTFPSSRKFPQFNADQLEKSLAQNGIEYLNILKLGGRRKAIINTQNVAWRHPAFRGYADYMESEDFELGIADLESVATQKCTAMMCSEAVWWRCHRSMVSDYLAVKGWKVLHIINHDTPKQHSFTQPARLFDGKLTYHDIGKPLHEKFA